MSATPIVTPLEETPQQKSEQTRRRWYASAMSAGEVALVTKTFPDGLDFEDIGLLLGINPGHAKMEYTRAILKLRGKPALMRGLQAAVREQRRSIDRRASALPQNDIDAGLDIDMPITA